MKDPRKVLLLTTIIGLALMFGITYLRETGSTALAPSGDQISASPSPVSLNYAEWGLFRNGYALPIPPDWKNTSDTGGTAVFEPGTKVGNIKKISVTRLSDAKVPPGQQFTTQKEFEEWSAVEGEVQGPIQKIANITVDSTPGLELSDIREDEGQWTVIVWVRKDNINLYLTFLGNEKITPDDNSAMTHIASEFAFVAPPSTGK